VLFTTPITGTVLTGSFQSGISLINTGVTPGTYPANPSLGQLWSATINAGGQVTAAANGAPRGPCAAILTLM